MKIQKLCKHIPESIAVEIVKTQLANKSKSMFIVDIPKGFKRLYSPLEIITDPQFTNLRVQAVKPLSECVIQIHIL